MKKFTIVLSIITAVTVLQAQDYQISFAGTGESTVVETVQVQNLTQGTSLLLNGSDVLHLVGEIGVGIEQIRANENNSMRIYPNPITTSSNIEFVMPTSGKVIMDLYDVAGKKITSTQNYLQAGTHTFNITGLTTGIYSLSINSGNTVYSDKIISNSAAQGIAKISYVNSTSELDKSSTLKSEKSLVQMQYNPDDRLFFTATSGDYVTISMLVPTTSSTETFYFAAATDYDGNNYVTVTIGNQTWMVEDLRVTHYPNGDAIPHVTDDAEWGDLASDNTSDAYCFYNNDNNTDYGALYSYAAAIGDNWERDNADGQGVCPDGWHLPGDAEWTTLADYLGGEDVAGGKMKSETAWDSPNSGATNSSGFSALPGGYRTASGGTFGFLGSNGYWWSATEPDALNAWIRYLRFDGRGVYRNSSSKSHGFSVRCILD